MSRFLVNTFCTYCSSFERDPSWFLKEVSGSFNRIVFPSWGDD